ncbi:MAG TPA: ankyrin repeat domain-containing protein, partial [Vicinamibacteria bacterium]|nr:ankyrin repeat domain-containing protein [Vicinamibacteria bacterium]
SGANVNKVETGRGRTPLHQIADHLNLDGERRDIAVLLLDKGAKADVKDSTGKTPLALALESRNDDAVKLLRERGAKE